MDFYECIWIQRMHPPRMHYHLPECNPPSQNAISLRNFVLNPGHKFHPGILDTQFLKNHEFRSQGSINPKIRRGVKYSYCFSKGKWNSGRVYGILGIIDSILGGFMWSTRPECTFHLKNKRTRGLNPKNRRGVKPSDWFSKRKWNSGRVDCILGVVFGCLSAFWAGLIDPPAQNSISH